MLNQQKQEIAQSVPDHSLRRGWGLGTRLLGGGGGAYMILEYVCRGYYSIWYANVQVMGGLSGIYTLRPKAQGV